jgi:hypothetical protein
MMQINPEAGNSNCRWPGKRSTVKPRTNPTQKGKSKCRGEGKPIVVRHSRRCGLRSKKELALF